VFAVLPTLTVGCRFNQNAHGSPKVVRGPAESSLHATVAPPVVARLSPEALRSIHPNELGRIPVLMYHAIGAPASGGPRYDRMGLNIAPETLRKHLDLMYDAGWYPVNMRDALTARMDVPAGKTPVVLTFDDARGTQFRLRKDGSLDPDCAVAILEQFHAEHPDWPLKASFYVLPRSKYNPPPFYQSGVEGKKLKYLVEKGFEVANHSTTHRLMRGLSARQLKWEMAQCIRYVRARAPKATMDTMALPGGSTPKDENLLDVLLKGADGTTAYSNLCILRAWGGATLPPTHRSFDRRDILRIGTAPGYVEAWIRLLSSGRVAAYVSDGDVNSVTVPARLARYLSAPRTNGLEIVRYDDRPDGTRIARRSPEPVPAGASALMTSGQSGRKSAPHHTIP
jgi:peptidoglycan/xylan/chitin deacetylase (PgdA/CDA1 family)